MREKLVHLVVSMLCASSTCLATSSVSPASAPYRFQNVTFIAGGFITGFVAHPAERGLYYVRTDIGGAYRWDNTAKRWFPLQDWLPFSQRNLLGAESIAIDPTDVKKLYLAAGTYTNNGTPNGAILRSEDQGRHFTIVRVPFKMGGNEDGRFAGERLQVDPNHPQTLLMATRLAGLWRSDDSGSTWARVEQFPDPPSNRIGLTFVAFDKSSGHAGQPTPVLYVGVDDPINNLLRSQDAGKTWKPVTGSPHGLFPNHGVFSSDGTMYLSFTDRPGPNGTGDGAVWAFSPSASTWKDITPQKPISGEQKDHANEPKATQDAQGFGYGTVAVDPHHPQTLLASTIDRWHPGDTIFRSTDGGAHWQSLKEGASRDASLAPWADHVAGAPFGHWIGAVMIDPFDSAHVLYGTGETIWESYDVNGGAVTHWTVGAPGLEETADIMLLSPLLPTAAGPHLFTGLGDIGCFRNDDFTHSPAGGAMKNPELSNCDTIALAAQRPQEMVRVGRSWNPGPHGAVSHDGGLHWTPFATEPEHGDQGGDAAISADGSLLLWAVRGGPLQLSKDSGANWRALSLQAGGRGGLQVLADTAIAQAFWIYDSADGVLDSMNGDGVASVVTRTAPKGGRLRVPPTAPDVLWIAGSSGLWRSNDRGIQFHQITTVASVYALGFGKAAPGATAPAIYLAAAIAGTPEAAPPSADEGRGGGIYRSLDDGATWQRIDDPEHRYAWIEQITGDPRVFGRIYMGTNGRGVLWGDPEK
ncbi:MAG TPA: hypothetical protein VMQ60_06085 [Acidobacteriaceae bacterium]|nr:hypothetical protein [Acidobacteriaceae bacterium]